MRKPLNPLMTAIVDLAEAIEWDNTDGLIYAFGRVGRSLVSCLVRNGMPADEAAKWAMHLANSLQDPDYKELT